MLKFLCRKVQKNASIPLYKGAFGTVPLYFGKETFPSFFPITAGSPRTLLRTSNAEDALSLPFPSALPAKGRLSYGLGAVLFPPHRLSSFNCRYFSTPAASRQVFCSGISPLGSGTAPLPPPWSEMAQRSRDGGSNFYFLAAKISRREDLRRTLYAPSAMGRQSIWYS